MVNALSCDLGALVDPEIVYGNGSSNNMQLLLR
jgi:hypothetical protein